MKMFCRKCNREIYWSVRFSIWLHFGSENIDGRMCVADPKTKDSQIIKICANCGGMIHNVEEGDTLSNYEHGSWAHVNDLVHCFSGGAIGDAKPLRDIL